MGIMVEIGDTGVGFDPEVVPVERLGLRVSIIERIAGVGGIATIDSAIGEGTVVTIEWPDPTGGPR
jgi:signal transduction histidine kinase